MPSTLRQILAEIEAAHKPPQLVIYHYATGDAVAEVLLEALLREARNVVDLGKGRSIMFHRAHVPNGQDHVHFLVKGDKVAALNRDGSAHDRSHGYQLQRWAVDGIATHHPDFKLPKDGLIEQLTTAPERILLTESGKATRFPRTLMALAEREALNAVPR